MSAIKTKTFGINWFDYWSITIILYRAGHYIILYYMNNTFVQHWIGFLISQFSMWFNHDTLPGFEHEIPFFASVNKVKLIIDKLWDLNQHPPQWQPRDSTITPSQTHYRDLFLYYWSIETFICISMLALI